MVGSIVGVLLVHSVKRECVEQIDEPVGCREVDVRVLTHVVTQCRRLGVVVVVVVVDVQVLWTVQRHQNNQSFLALHHNVVMKCYLKLVHTVRAACTHTHTHTHTHTMHTNDSVSIKL